MDRVFSGKNLHGTRYLIREFFKAITGSSMVAVLGLFATFGAENFIK